MLNSISFAYNISQLNRELAYIQVVYTIHIMSND